MKTVMFVVYFFEMEMRLLLYLFYEKQFIIRIMLRAERQSENPDLKEAFQKRPKK